MPRGPDVPSSRGSPCVPTSTRHQLIVLPFFCGSGELDDLADDERPGDGGGVDRLLLQADPDEVGGDGLGGRVGGQRDVLGEPGQRDAGHQSTPANCWEKRTSPSTMSRMSATPWRSMRVRSIPMPKAKPE